MLVRVGTRKSKLALTQTQIITDALKQRYPQLEFEIHEITTSGDRIYDQDLALIGGKGLFLKEIEEELIQGNIDIAVHSMKDVPAFLPEGLVIDCTYKREEPQDVFSSEKYASITELPSNAIVGTSSLRRRLQLLSLRKDLQTVSFRGNVPTRIQKMCNGEVDGCILAYAGIKRLELTEHIKQILPISDFLPAIAQGAIGVERRANDQKMQELLAAINDPQTYTCITAERAFMQAMEASCTTPIAAYATLAGNIIHLQVQYFDPQTHESFKISVHGDSNEALTLGKNAASEIQKLCSH